jgi:putative nucleotidyltransferase with HDIG domain
MKLGILDRCVEGADRPPGRAALVRSSSQHDGPTAQRPQEASMKQDLRLFSDKLDRLTFSTYFLGAVVPLLCLAVVVERFALPAVSESNQSLALIGLLACTALLSLGSFLLLRSATRRSLARMDRDNHRLTSLLRVSSRLSSVQHVTDATDTAAQCALEQTHGSAAYLMLKGAENPQPTLAAAAGEEAAKLYEAIGTHLAPLVTLAMEGSRPALSEAGTVEDFSAVAVPLPGERGPIGALVAVRKAPGRGFVPEEIDGLATLAGLAAVALHNGDLRDAQRNFFSHVTDMLVTALDAHLGFNQGHGERVAQLANHMGRALGMGDEDLQRLHFAALLHDIGMLKLDRNQQMNRRTCDKHTVLGSRMLGRIRLWKEIAPIVHHHHEWFDGSGYPDGSAGEEIPLEARIIALCDAWDSMTSENSYKPAATRREASDEIAACAGTQFDPELVRTFLALVDKGEI